MNSYKKTIMALGIALVIIPQAFALEKAYHADAYSPFKPQRDWSKWNNDLANIINDVKKNGGNDQLLVEAVNKLLVINANFVGAMKAGNTLFDNPTASGKSALKNAFSNNRAKIEEIAGKLRKETYLIPGKRKSREMLLEVLDELHAGHMKAETELK